jgi:hypothetical protein
MFDSSPLKENLANIIFIISVALQSCDSFLKNYLCFKNKLVFFFAPVPLPLITESFFLVSTNKQTKIPVKTQQKPGRAEWREKSLARAGSSPWFNGLLEARTG